MERQKTHLEFLENLVGTHRVVGLSFLYGQNRMHEFLSSAIPNLKKKGLEYALFPIPSTLQGAVESYGGFSKELIEDSIDGFAYEDENSEYLNIIRVAQNEGVQVIAGFHPCSERVEEQEELDKYFANRIPEKGKCLVYHGELALRKDIPDSVRGLVPEMYSVLTVANPSEGVDEFADVEIVEFLKNFYKFNSNFPVQFGVDLSDKKNSFVREFDSYLERKNCFSRGEWYDGLVVY